MSLDEVESLVLSYPKLKKRLDGRPDEEKKALKAIAEIRGNFSPKLIKTISNFIDMTFARLYDGLSLDMPQGMDLKKLSAENNIVFVPNHQSHADYIALTYLIYNQYKIPIYVAGGINLNIFPLGMMFRNSGCFFIRRSFGNDITYKLTLEGYLYYLLKKRLPIEFFFEGGRSRTGKLLPPRFGFFSMLLESHEEIEEDKKPILFIPVSIVHEYVPETRAHVNELRGGQKKREKVTQLLNLYKLFALKLGSIHVKLGKPIKPNKKLDLKEKTQDLAFRCYRQVGKQMSVTPTSLISMILLDEPSGALTWSQIYDKACLILNYCRAYKIPLSKALEKEKDVKSIKHALNILIGNKKVDLIKNEKLDKDYYFIKKDSRQELLYFKNTILHHFLVPYFINAAWVNIFNGRINNFEQLKVFLIEQRKQMVFEFYLPTVRELLTLALQIVSDCVGKQVSSLSEAFELSTSDLYKIMSKLGVFSSSCNYIFEAYYICAMTLKHLGRRPFTREEFLRDSSEISALERSHGRVIKYSESYSNPLMNSSFNYFNYLKLFDRENGKFVVNDTNKVDELIDLFTHRLVSLLTMGLKHKSSSS